MYKQVKNIVGLVKWYWILAIGIIVGQLVFMLMMGEDIYASVHDNLELHVMNYHLLSETGTFFTRGEELPILNGISRDYFASQWSLYSLLYMIFPTNTAYILGGSLKVMIGLFSSVLLAKDIYQEAYKKYEGIVVLTGLAFGLLPLYPTFSFPFVSLPYLIWILRKIWREPRWKWYMLLFFYPLVSYFTFMGVFILGYVAVTILYLLLKKRQYVVPMVVSLLVLTLGYVILEYRLFRIMLFDDLPTIRDTMVMGSLDVGEVMDMIQSVLVYGVFHADASHTYFLLPIVIVGLAMIVIRGVREKQYKALLKEPLVLTVGLIILNAVIHGIYYYEPFRTLVETLLPPAKGLQFNRTSFFNPFLWYVALFFVLQKLIQRNYKKVAYGVVGISILVVMTDNSRYNDVYMTAKYTAYEIIKNEKSTNLTYREFYSEALFRQIKEEIAYESEKVLSYGLDPAVAAYNGFHTLDGCLSYYPLSYKAEFREVIAPALAQNQQTAAYYDDWGARAYLFPASDDLLYSSEREVIVTDDKLYVNMDAIKSLDGLYIISRIQISNAEELALHQIGIYTEDTSPYTIYLYQVESEHKNEEIYQNSKSRPLG